MTHLTETLKAIDTYGVALSMLVLFCLASWYVLRRLLHPQTGIVTAYIAATAKSQGILAKATASQDATGKRLAVLMEAATQSLERSETQHGDPHSPYATGALSRSFRTGCDVLEMIADKLGTSEGTKPLLDLMRRDLDAHIAAIQRPLDME